MKKAILIILLLGTTFSFAQDFQPLLDSATRNLLHEALSGELAKEHTIHISRFHRIQGSRGYRAAANYVLEQLRNFGFTEEQAYIESYKSDGKKVYQTWQSPSGWDMEEAELRMVKPYDERIVGFPEIPMALMTYSNPGDVTAELVWVGRGTSDSDYEGKDVKGKFVLATGYGGSVHRLAVLKYGAKAVVCYLDDARAMEYPDMLAYTGMWPKTEELDRVTFGFNLTHRQGEKLKSLLTSGQKVVLRGWAKGIGLEPYWMDIPVAEIKGSEKPEETFIICGHLDHPKESANDNASGSGAMLDMCRALKNLIETGRMPQPKRSIRFLWVPEFYGTMAYIDAHENVVGPALGGKILANINLDMVGEHLELIHTNMNLTSTPASVPSVFNDVMANMAAMVDRMNIRTPRGSKSRFNYRIRPYGGGSDHAIFVDRKIPAMMIGHGDYTHHTSEDTGDKVDPVELERTEIISAGAVLYLSNLDEGQFQDLLNLTAANCAQRLGQAGRRAMKMIANADEDNSLDAWAEALNRVDHHTRWQKETLKSITHYKNQPVSQSLIKKYLDALDHQAASIKNIINLMAMKHRGNGAKPSSDVKTDNRIPVRLTRGPLASGFPEDKIPEEDAIWYRKDGRALGRNMRFEIVNFIDGKRTITEIRNAVSAEFNPVPVDFVGRYIDDLVRAGVVKWK